MEEALRAYLRADAALAALVSTRVEWLKRPQGSALPSVTLQIASAPRSYTMGGRVALVGYLVQMDVWAASYTSMKAVSRALIVALDGLIEAPFQAALIENERETTEPQDGPDATGSTDFYRSSLDVRVWHQPVPA